MRTGTSAGQSFREGMATHIGPLLIRLLGATLRVWLLGAENIARARAAAGNVIYAFWHGRLFILTYVHRNQGIKVLVSTHRDGEYIARVIGGLGFGTVRGSTTKGAIGALLQLTEAGTAKTDIAFTPDGPRGPRERCQPGAIYVAKKTGLPVIPIGTSCRPRLVLRSWDRFMIPPPLARCVVVYGEPAFYGGSLAEDAVEQARLDLEGRLKDVTRKADDACGWHPR
jgi:lysophospholipid acyltransferase (LPLAT)-like uncharacterized protein